MLRLSSLLALAATASLIACPTPTPIEGEGDDGREGEGEVGEGEGDVAEGEGDVVVGEGEGDVVVGEGEGDVVVGEGEGDVVAGEGEGDVVAGEGEGEVVAGSGLDAVRAAAAGAINVDVADVVVTYARAGFDASNNQQGFYVQQGPRGPAIFVRSTEAITAGTLVSFTATSTVASEGRLEIATITNLVRGGRGDLDALVQDFSNDSALVTGIADRESELARTTVTLTADVATNAGAGFQKAAASTLALATVPTGITLRLAPDARTGAGVFNGCGVTVTAPLGHTKFAADEVQVTAFELSQVTAVTNCQSSIGTATAIDSTHVVVNFNRALRASSVAANGSGFSITGTNLAVTAATVSGNAVTLTTAAQTPGTAYTVNANASVVDTFGGAYANTGANFSGFQALGLVINEVDYDQAGNDTDEWVEVINLGANAVDLSTLQVVFVDGAAGHTVGRRLAGTGSVAGNGGIALFQFTPNDLQNGPDAVVLWDNANHTKLDGVSYEAASTTGITIDGVTFDVTGPGLTDPGDGSICRDPSTRLFEECATTTKNAANN